MSLAVDASSCGWFAASLERSASHSCSGSLSTASIAADQPERDDPEAIEKKFVVMISPAAAVLVSSAIENDSTAPRFRSDYLSACTTALRPDSRFEHECGELLRFSKFVAWFVGL